VWPGPEGSIKDFWSELNQRVQQVAQELMGPYGQLQAGDPLALDKESGHTAICARAGTLSKLETSEVQRNIIGHFVLGLPRSY